MLLTVKSAKRVGLLACLIAMLITPGCGMVHRPAVVVDKMVVIDGSTGKVVSTTTRVIYPAAKLFRPAHATGKAP